MRSALVIALAGAAAVFITPAARADTTVLSCDDASLRSAVAAGGRVTFGVDCPQLETVDAITIGAGADVTIDAAGHSVVVDGQDQHRLFQVDGGTRSRAFPLPTTS